MKHMLHIVLAGVLAAVFALATPSGAAEEPRPIETLEDLPREARLALFDAQQALESGDAQKATDVLGKYVRDHAKKDDRFLMRYHYASMLVQLDKREDALKEYERVVALEPRYDAGWLGLGETAYGLGQYLKASQALKQGYELSVERRPEVLYYAAAAQLLGGDARGAVPVLEDLTSGKHGTPKFEWYRGLVSACLQAEEPARARQAVDSMLEKFASNPDAWYLAFQFHASVSDYQHAVVALTCVSYLRPLTRQEQLQLGDLYAAVDAPAAAADYYVSATTDSASAPEVERVASAFLASYQSEEALKVLEHGINASPTFRLWSLLGDLHVMEKRYDEAYKAFTECARLSPDEARPHLLLGYCALELNQPDLAIGHLTTAAANEEFAERAQSLIQRAQIMRAAPTPEASRPTP